MATRGDYPFGSETPVTMGFNAILGRLGEDQGSGGEARSDYPYGSDPATSNPVTKGFKAVLDLLDAIGVVVGKPWASAPLMNGTANPGSSDDYARGDHVHPSDTNKADAVHAHGSITGAGAIEGVTVATGGDALVVTDASDGHRLKRSGISLGDDVTRYLRNDGTWDVPVGFDVVDGRLRMTVTTAEEDE